VRPSKDTPSVDAQGLREQAQHELGPERGELIELNGGTVEVIDEGIVVAGVEVQRAHDAGYAEQFGPHREPATAVVNHRKACRRENAGRSRQITFHQWIHSDIGSARCCL
jgi:hypothetical protein